VWWTWDAKLTTTLILWFIYVGYLMLRAYGPKGSQGARFGAVVAIFGAIDTVPIYFATTLWRTAHPELVVGPVAESGSLDPSMGVALLVSFIAFSFLYTYMLTERYSLRRAESEIDELYRHVS
jgi:heme exporter protein C